MRYLIFCDEIMMRYLIQRDEIGMRYHIPDEIGFWESRAARALSLSTGYRRLITFPADLLTMLIAGLIRLWWITTLKDSGLPCLGYCGQFSFSADR